MLSTYRPVAMGIPADLGGATPLQSYWLAVLPLAAAGLLGLWWLRLRRLGRPSVRLTSAAGIMGVVLSLVGAAGVANAYVGYVPTVTAASRLTGLPDPSAGDLPFLAETSDGSGRVFTAVVADPANAVPPSTVWVYTPPGYYNPGNSARYPVVYLLHGSPGRSPDWFSAGGIDTVMDSLIRTRTMAAAIVVAPDMNGGGLRDTQGLNVAGGPQIANYLSTTIPAWTDAHLRTIPDAKHRVLGGMSAGGYAALNLGLHTSKTFAGIIALEPYGQPGKAGLRTLGGNLASLAANSPSTYIAGIQRGQGPTVFIDVGGSGSTAPTVRLASQLQRQGMSVRFQIEPGQGHTWREARAGIPYGLTYVSRTLGWSATASGSG